MPTLYEATRDLPFNQIFATYNKVKAKAHNKLLVDKALSVIQSRYWRVTNYQTFVNWSEQAQRQYYTTAKGCNCDAFIKGHQSYCKHMVARFIILRALQRQVK